MKTSKQKPKVGIIMGSDSDLPIMAKAADVLDELGVPYEITVVSAHRTPKEAHEYGKSATRRGLEVIIAGAGVAAHLAGTMAAVTHIPVIGVPIASGALKGADALYSTVQMPPGVPVATVGIDNGKNAGLLAAQMIALHDKRLEKRFIAHKKKQGAILIKKAKRLTKIGHKEYLNG